MTAHCPPYTRCGQRLYCTEAPEAGKGLPPQVGSREGLSVDKDLRSSGVSPGWGSELWGGAQVEARDGTALYSF